ncbi:hypothetical protein [Caulobacter sp.]|uniref:hypothetical protein n=1 Tax=Caulobacter sp. TaxID=78 RepID=UPI001B18F13A|nr:hypothetical protein [Caulobacter sp.]MBO9547276.1 hypothetical protein [Caulobacter sp.]
MLSPLIFIGVAGDHRTTFVDLDVAAVDPAARAQSLLAEHRSCDAVEVWREERVVAVVARPQSGPAA